MIQPVSPRAETILALADRAVSSWASIADALDISLTDRRTFSPGREVQGIVSWLEARTRLHALVDAVVAAGRPDLQELCQKLVSDIPSTASPAPDSQARSDLARGNGPQSVTCGTLPDSAILALVEQGQLISKNFNRNGVKQACYELRASELFYLPPDPRSHTGESATGILIRPHQLVVVMTQEQLSLPSDILGRVLTKGQLFSIGILPVNTYADPGFVGQLGIVLHNLSNNYVRIRSGEPIAKIEFSRIQRAVSTPYRGPHGNDSKIWPIPVDLILTADEIVADPRIGPPGAELAISHGIQVATLLGSTDRRSHVATRLSALALGVSILTGASVLGSSKLLAFFVSIVCLVLAHELASRFPKGAN